MSVAAKMSLFKVSLCLFPSSFIPARDLLLIPAPGAVPELRACLST